MVEQAGQRIWIGGKSDCRSSQGFGFGSGPFRLDSSSARSFNQSPDRSRHDQKHGDGHAVFGIANSQCSSRHDEEPVLDQCGAECRNEADEAPTDGGDDKHQEQERQENCR